MLHFHSLWQLDLVVQVGLPLGGLAPSIPMARVAGWELELIGSHGIAASDFPSILQVFSFVCVSVLLGNMHRVVLCNNSPLFLFFLVPK